MTFWSRSASATSFSVGRAVMRARMASSVDMCAGVCAVESRRSGVRCALGSMAKPVLPDAAFGEVWRNISEMLRVGGVGKALRCPAIPGIDFSMLCGRGERQVSAPVTG